MQRQNAEVPIRKNRSEAISPHEESVLTIEENGRETLNKPCGDLHCISEGDRLACPGERMLAPMSPGGNVKTIGERTYMRIRGLVDSGTVDSVTNNKTAPWIPTQQIAASRSGMGYTVADGRTALNRGQPNLSRYN